MYVPLYTRAVSRPPFRNVCIIVIYVLSLCSACVTRLSLKAWLQVCRYSWQDAKIQLITVKWIHLYNHSQLDDSFFKSSKALRFNILWVHFFFINFSVVKYLFIYMSICLSVYLYIKLSLLGDSGDIIIVPCGKFWSPCLGMALQLQEQRYTHSYHCVQYFFVFEQWYGCQCLGFFNCTLMPVSGIFKLHTDVYACDCTQELYTVRESALEKQTLPHQGLKPTLVVCSTHWAITTPKMMHGT